MRKVFILMSLLLVGCSWFEDRRTVVKLKVDMTSPEYRKMLSEIINSRYDGEMLRSLAADIDYWNYLRGQD